MAEADRFLGKVKLLEKLKADHTLSDLLYESGRFILLYKNDMVCLNNCDRLIYKEYEDVKKWNKHARSKTVLLDVLTASGSDVCLFAVDLEATPDCSLKDIENEVNGKFVNMRHSLFFLNNEESKYINHARGLINFCQSFKFCSFCGGSLKANEGGHKKQCEKCNTIHYPTLPPVGLSLVEDEKHEEVLLVRQERHVPGMYTCVAGFIEPGESLEENIRREVAEEVGLMISKVEYCTSQHWALPNSQLTLGCIATAIDKAVQIDAKEIQDAKWVKAEVLKEAVMRTRQLKNLDTLDGEKLWAPPINAVSHNVMVAWLKKYHNFEPTS